MTIRAILSSALCFANIAFGKSLRIENVSPGEKESAEVAASSKMKQFSEAEKLDYLIKNLGEPRLYSFISGQLAKRWEMALPALRVLVINKHEPVPSRANALKLLAAKGDVEVLEKIKSDELLFLRLTSFEEEESPEIATFQRAFIALELINVSPEKRMETLDLLIKQYPQMTQIIEEERRKNQIRP